MLGSVHSFKRFFGTYEMPDSPLGVWRKGPPEGSALMCPGSPRLCFPPPTPILSAKQLHQEAGSREKVWLAWASSTAWWR